MCNDITELHIAEENLQPESGCLAACLVFNRLIWFLCGYVWCVRLPQVITQRMPEAVVRGERNASVKQLRLRLASVKSIQRITKVFVLDCYQHPASFSQLVVCGSLDSIPKRTLVTGIFLLQTMKMVAAAKLKGFQTRMFEVNSTRFA